MWLKFDVFGTPMSVLRQNGEWLLFRDSGTGLRARVYEVVIPAELSDKDLASYLADIFHENATAHHANVTRSNKS
ncbi:hypothetical protein HR45_04855 [Shewanella mangrovi]|uniref:DUF7661 domain-containing protein n=1 Tax=Shewanella mangrovi TaxID=1515746 RepID=A0A094JHR5_9GAMM|nr:hypothetical protein [Shewanella mangrovi]KFZ38747.1 hypothetical protein HR45_04855 [Shewanella mangrovi]